MYEVSEKIGLAYYINKNTFATFQKKNLGAMSYV